MTPRFSASDAAAPPPPAGSAGPPVTMATRPADTWPGGVVMARFSESPPLVAPGCSRALALVLL
jgi:hypothetical protein